MNQEPVGRYSVIGRVFAAALLVAIGLAAAMPFRNRERQRPPTAKATTSDNVRLVLRNQDIAVQVNPRVEESPAAPLVSPFPAAVNDPGDPAQPQLDDVASLPELPAQYRSLLDPSAMAPTGTRPPAVVNRIAPPPPSPREHILADGDTLSRLAERYLGDATRSGEILAWNTDAITDPSLLPIGRVIRIPPRTPVAEPALPTPPRPATLQMPTSIVREPSR